MYRIKRMYLILCMCSGKPSTLDDTMNRDWAPNVNMESSEATDEERPSAKKCKLSGDDRPMTYLQATCQSEQVLKCDASTQYDGTDIQCIPSVTLKGNITYLLVVVRSLNYK